MSQSSILANIWVLIAAVPYLAIAGYDFWLHENDRQVPRAEQYFHAGMFSFIDVLFGTYAETSGQQHGSGAAIPETLLAHLAWPFKIISSELSKEDSARL